MNTIVTFYSYKGGVGRSMALANVAVLLAQRKLRVLAVDWDLEAPGLDRYFGNYFTMDAQGAGLLPLLTDAAQGKKPNYEDYLWQVHVDPELSFSFLSSGIDQDPDYSSRLDKFDWNAFYEEQDGGRFIEDLRDQWHSEYDFVLIDSRTGLSDIGGICTIQLPDVVIPMFTANHQSLYGVRDVMRLAQHARQSLAYDRMALTIFPLPSRFGKASEFRESKEWLDRFDEALKEFYADWLPVTVRPRQVLERIKVPQIDYFGFGEKLAVVEEGVGDIQGMGYVYNQVADVLVSDFADLDVLVGQDVAAQAIKSAQARRQERRSKAFTPAPEDYEYDLYVSYAHSTLTSEWIRELVSDLSPRLELELAGEPQVFLDIQELVVRELWFERAQEALRHAKLLLAVVSPRYFQSDYTLFEWLTFERRQQALSTPLIVPVVMSGSIDAFPDWFTDLPYCDAREFVRIGDAFQRTPKYVQYQDWLTELAGDITKRLKSVPPFDPAWPVASLDEAKKRAAPLSEELQPPSRK